MARATSRARAFAVRIGGSLLLLMAVWFWPLASRHVSPSFDCARATRATEVLICGDPQLATIDVEAAHYYQDNLQTATGFGDRDAVARLIGSQAQFLTARNRCGSAKWCVEREYAAWDRDVQTIGGAPHRITPAAATRPRPTGYLGPYLLGLIR